MKKFIIAFCLVSCLTALVNPLHAQWTQIAGSAGQKGLCFASVDSTLYVGTNIGVAVIRDDGSSWSKIGLSSQYINSLAVVGSIVLAAANDGIFRSSDHGANWSAANDGLTNQRILSTAVMGNEVFIGTYVGPSYYPSSGAVDAIYVSSDIGLHWRSVFTLLPTTHFSYNVLLAAAGNNLISGYSGGGVSRSSDHGVTWTKPQTGLGSTMISALAASGSKVIAGSWDGISLSENTGVTWTAIPYPIWRAVNALAFSGTQLFAAMDGAGAFVSANNGASWTDINSGLPKAGIRALTVFGANAYAATDSGIWRRPLAEFITGVNEDQKPLPLRCSLAQNFPNPFNPSTTISFSLPSRSFVTVKIFDVMGREVSTLVNEALQAGTHSRQWNASAMPSGMYFYRLQAGSFIETKRLALLK